MSEAPESSAQAQTRAFGQRQRRTKQQGLDDKPPNREKDAEAQFAMIGGCWEIMQCLRDELVRQDDLWEEQKQEKEAEEHRIRKLEADVRRMGERLEEVFDLQEENRKLKVELQKKEIMLLAHQIKERLSPAALTFVANCNPDIILGLLWPEWASPREEPSPLETLELVASRALEPLHTSFDDILVWFLDQISTYARWYQAWNTYTLILCEVRRHLGEAEVGAMRLSLEKRAEVIRLRHESEGCTRWPEIAKDILMESEGIREWTKRFLPTQASPSPTKIEQ